jgi:hypothetical protein
MKQHMFACFPDNADAPRARLKRLRKSTNKSAPSAPPAKEDVGAEISQCDEHFLAHADDQGPRLDMIENIVLVGPSFLMGLKRRPKHSGALADICWPDREADLRHLVRLKMQIDPYHLRWQSTKLTLPSTVRCKMSV